MFRKAKWFSLMLALLIAMSMILTGCGGAPAEPPTSSEPPAQEQDAVSAEAEQEPDEAEAEEPGIEANILGWKEWSGKMAGSINQDYYIVDLRTPDEIKLEKALAGSINIDAKETFEKFDDSIIDEELGDLPKDATVLIHCKSGGRAKKYLDRFLDKGFVNAYALDAWTSFDNEGYIGGATIDSDNEQVNPDVWTGKMQGTIGQDYYVVDVRDKDEYEDGHIAGAINVGVRDQWTVDHKAALAVMEKEVPNKDALLLVHCAKGVRAKVGQAHLKAAGYTNVIILDNEINIDADGNYEFE